MKEWSGISALSCTVLSALLAVVHLDCTRKESMESVVQAGLGEVEFRIDILGYEVHTLEYVIVDSDGNLIREGVVDISNVTQPPIRFSIENLPAGEDYTISIVALGESSSLGCVGQTMFDIVVGGRTTVEVILSCDLVDTGDSFVDVEIGLNICPNIDSVAIAPSQACVGETVDLVATASDRDPADVIDFSWTIDGVLFATGPSPSYLCAEAGIKTVNLSVSDGKCDDIHASSFVCRDCEGDSESNSDDDADTGSEEPSFWGQGESCDQCMETTCSVEIFGVDFESLCPPSDSECRAPFDCALGDNAKNEICVEQSEFVIPCICGDLSYGECMHVDLVPSERPNGVCLALFVERPLDFPIVDENGRLLLNDGGQRASTVLTCMSLFCSDECGIPQ